VVVVAAVLFVVGVALYASSGWVYVGMGVGVNVDVAVVVGAGPRMVVDEDGVTSPAKACTVPAVASEGGADGDDGAETDSCADDESGAGPVEDDRGTIDGDVVVGGVDGLDFNVATVVRNGVVGVGDEVAVVVGEAALALDGVHDVRALAEDGVAKGAGPLRVAGHHVKDVREGQEGEDARVPGEVVGLDGLGKGVAVHEAVLLGPGGGVGDLIPEGGGGEDLGEERVGIKGDALDELVELLGSDGRRGRLLLLIGLAWLLLVLGLVLLRVGWWILWVRLGLLLVWWWRWWCLTFYRGLGKGDDAEGQQNQSCQRFVNGLHIFVIPAFLLALSALFLDSILERKLLGDAGSDWSS
jgi:hypothetical protein